MKPSEIRELSRTEVEDQVREKEEELVNLRLRLVTHQLENALVVRSERRELARLKTILKEHDLGIRILSE